MYHVCNVWNLGPLETGQNPFFLGERIWRGPGTLPKCPGHGSLGQSLASLQRSWVPSIWWNGSSNCLGRCRPSRGLCRALPRWGCWLDFFFCMVLLYVHAKRHLPTSSPIRDDGITKQTRQAAMWWNNQRVLELYVNFHHVSSSSPGSLTW